jgi:antitoxin ParD1/3/4
MHISLTPELEAQVKSKVETGYYNNASEVIRDALRFMINHEELIHLMKIDALRKELAVGEKQARDNEFSDASVSDIIQEAKSETNA